MSIDELHHKMGHILPKAAKHMIKAGLVDGIKLDSKPASEFCVACTKAKITRTLASIPKSCSHKATELGECMHLDLWGPAQTQALTGESYFITFTNKAKAWSEFNPLKVKNLTFKSYTNYEAWLKTQFGMLIKEFHCNGGGEFINSIFDAHLKANGTKCTITVHHTPEQNGISECLNCTLLKHTWAMIISSGLPRFLWVEAVHHAVWLKNQLSTCALHGKTPCEAMVFGQPNLSDLHEWGCTVWVKVDGGKLDPKAVEGQFMGYDSE
jgi:hypothetical protein